MSTYIKSFNNATDMRAYLDSAPGMKYYLLKNEAGEAGIGNIPESGKSIVSLYKGRDYLTFTAQEDDSRVEMVSKYCNHFESAEYSLDNGVTWTNAKGVTVTLTNIGDSVKYRGVMTSGRTDGYYAGVFNISRGRMAATGSIMSLYNNNPNDKIISFSKCFYRLFFGCERLSSAPELPATTLAESCYESMFQGCISLTTAPELPATTLAESCYSSMFNGCTSLNYVKHHINSWSIYHTMDWLNSTASTGTVECPTASTIPSDNVSGIPTGWTRVNF